MKFLVFFLTIASAKWDLSVMEASNKIHKLKMNRIKLNAMLCSQGSPEFEQACLMAIFNSDYFWL